MLKPDCIVEKLTPLKKELADQRLNMISNVNYNLQLDLSSSEPNQNGICIISLNYTESESHSLIIDFKGQEISLMSINKKDAIPQSSWKDDKLIVPTSFFSQGVNTIEIHYLNKQSKTSSGLYRQEDPKDQGVQIYTDLEPFHCHTFVPCFDQPSLKATLNLKLKTVKSATNIANQPISDEKIDGEFKQTTFEQCPKISTYLFALVSGPYVGKTHIINYSLNGNEYSVPISLQSRATMTEWLDYDDWFAKSEWAMKYLIKYFDFPYPFAKYDNVFVPNQNMGAMENVGLVTFNETRIQQSKIKIESVEMRMYNTMIHEMSHQWFGNLVTMQWWDDLWLNEAFATFIAYLLQDRWQWKSHQGTPWLSQNTRKVDAMNDDRMQSITHAVANSYSTTEEAEESFDMITQGKGSSLIKQLFYNIGDESFKSGIREQFQTQQWKNTEREDFLSVMAKHTSFDVIKQGNEWICASGLNGVTCKVEMDGDKCGSFVIHQYWYTNPIYKSFKVPIKVFFKDQTSKILTITIENNETTNVEELAGTEIIGQLFNQEDYVYVEYQPGLQDVNFVINNQELIKDHSLDLKSLDEAILISMKSLKLDANISYEYQKFRFANENINSISVDILEKIKYIVSTYSKKTEEAKTIKKIRNDEMIKLITAKQNIDKPTNSKKQFEYAKFFMQSTEHMNELEGQIVNQDFPWFQMGNEDYLSIVSLIIVQKCVSIEKKENLVKILEGRVGASNELKQLKILLFAIKADKEDLYQLLKCNIMDRNNKQQEMCKDQDQHEYSICIAGLITNVNEDSDWAKELTNKRLWDDLISVAALLEQRKFKKFYQGLISQKDLNQQLLDNVIDCLHRCKQQSERIMVLEKCLSNTIEIMTKNLKNQSL